MPEQDPVRVEVTTTFLVDPEGADAQAWRDRVRGAQRSLGALIDATSVEVEFSFDGLNEEDYDARRTELKRAAEVQEGEELARAGEALGRDMTGLLLEVGTYSERSSKQLGGTLRNDSLDNVRAVLAVGRDQLTRYAGISGVYGAKSMNAIDEAMDHLGISLPEALSVSAVAQFCDNLEQVPGYVLLRIAREADAKEYQARRIQQGVVARGRSVYRDPLEAAKLRPLERWPSDLLKRSVAELDNMSLDDITSVIATRIHDFNDEVRDLELAEGSAQTLQRIVRQYAADFIAVKKAREAGRPA